MQDSEERTQGILNIPRVELDNALDAVEVGNTDVERVLHDQKGDAFGARGRGQRAGVLEDV